MTKKDITVKIGDAKINLKLTGISDREFKIIDKELGEVEAKVLDIDEDKVEVLIDGHKYVVFRDRESKMMYVNGIPTKISIVKKQSNLLEIKPRGKRQSIIRAKSNSIVSPLSGRIVSIKTKKGDFVERGDTLLIMESMKMLNEIKAPFRGVVKEIKVNEGELVKKDQVLVILKKTL